MTVRHQVRKLIEHTQQHSTTTETEIPWVPLRLFIHTNDYHILKRSEVDDQLWYCERFCATENQNEKYSKTDADTMLNSTTLICPWEKLCVPINGQNISVVNEILLELRSEEEKMTQNLNSVITQVWERLFVIKILSKLSHTWDRCTLNIYWRWWNDWYAYAG